MKLPTSTATATATATKSPRTYEVTIAVTWSGCQIDEDDLSIPENIRLASQEGAYRTYEETEARWALLEASRYTATTNETIRIPLGDIKRMKYLALKADAKIRKYIKNMPREMYVESALSDVKILNYKIVSERFF